MNKELSNMCNKSTSDCIELAKQLKALQEENDTLNEIIKTLQETNRLLINQKYKLEYELDLLDSKRDKAIVYIRENCILSDCWEDLDFCNFVPVGRIKYKSLSSKKVKELLDILKGSEE